MLLRCALEHIEAVQTTDLPLLVTHCAAVLRLTLPLTLSLTLTPNQVAGTIGTALAVSSLGVVITLLGAVCSTSVQFILPGAAYFVLFREPGGCKRWLALAQLLLGLVIMPLCLTLAFL